MITKTFFKLLTYCTYNRINVNVFMANDYFTLNKSKLLVSKFIT